MAVHCAPSPRCDSAMLQRLSPGPTEQDAPAAWLEALWPWLASRPRIGAAAWTSGPIAPAADEMATGAPTEVTARTPRAMRPASQSTKEFGPDPVSPRRTRSATDRSNWAQHASQATQAASVSTQSASRARGDQSCPIPRESGLPTANASTAGTAAKTRSAATSAPATSVRRAASGSDGSSAIGRPRVEGVGQRGRL